MSAALRNIALVGLGALMLWSGALVYQKLNPALGATPPASTLASTEVAWVTDEAGLLTPRQERDVALKLSELAREIGPQMVVVTVESLQGKDVQHFADELGNRRRLGRPGRNDGVLILVAPTERQVRISYANGLKGKLSDAFCAEVIRRDMTPRFRTGDMAGGILAGVNALDVELRKVMARQAAT